TVARPGWMARLGAVGGSCNHHHRPAASQVPRAERAGECLAVPARQRALKPRVRQLRRDRQPLLSRLEQARRPAVEDHVPRTQGLGTSVLINERWYYAAQGEAA